MRQSRLSGFYKLTVPERQKTLQNRHFLTEEDFTQLKNQTQRLSLEDADRMIENVVGVFGLPYAVGLNFLVNNKEYIVPMVVEEPSIVAAVSSMAKIIHDAGGFRCSSDDPILIGQVQVMDVEYPAKAKHAILENKDEIINLANSLHPNMVARGGGTRDVEVRIFPKASYRGDILVVHLLVDVQDAMGANLVNSMCEGVASLIEKITGGNVFLRILSNLADRSLARAEVTIPVKLLKGQNYSGEEVRDGIILANEFAIADPYRATTHNKGIMNGIDPVAIATGNDWRAIEAAAHAYAARKGRYTALTEWTKNQKGDLFGKIELPMRIGTVGGNLQSNPAVPMSLRLLNIQSAKELAEIIAAVGLAQNMGALRALATEGIQRGHMSLHARSVASTAGATPDIFETVVEKLVASGEIKVWKAQEIIDELKTSGQPTPQKAPFTDTLHTSLPTGFGKVILFGEHAVVYGSHAIAAPVPLGVQAKVVDGEDGIHLIIPRWGVEERIRQNVEHQFSIFMALDCILDHLDLHQRDMKIEVFPNIPRAMGLGGSAALAVAIIRALSEHFDLKLNDEQVCSLAYESERIVHGKASGIDNTVAAYGQFLLFRKGRNEASPKIRNITGAKPLPVVVGMTWVESLTAKMVEKVRRAWEKTPTLYDTIFHQIDAITLQALIAIEEGDLVKLGELMNVNQGLLNALQVSTREIEEITDIARKNGALGAKLTGGGGGGAVIALCDDLDACEKVAAALKKSGFKSLVTSIQ